MGYVKWMDNNPKWLKVVLAIFLGIFWGIYRIVKSVVDGNMLGVVLGILLLIFGFWIIWLVDIITLIVMDKILWF